MNSAQRCRSQRRAYELTYRSRETKARYGGIVREFGSAGHDGLLGPIVHERRIAEVLHRLAAGAPLGTDLREALQRAANRPASYVMWIRRHQLLVEKILSESRTSNMQTPQ
jgi:hypothetical protein